MPSPEAVFSVANSAVLPGWLVLVLAPRWRHSARLVCAVVIPGLLAVLYAAVIAARWGGAEGFSSLADFLRTWEGRPAASSTRLPGLELPALDGRGNEVRFEEVVLAAVDGARDEIHVECAYMTSPFLERLGAAARRGVKVTVVAPEANNWGLVRDLLRWPRGDRRDQRAALSGAYDPHEGAAGERAPARPWY